MYTNKTEDANHYNYIQLTNSEDETYISPVRSLIRIAIDSQYATAPTKTASLVKASEVFP